MTGPTKNILCPVELKAYSLSALESARAIASPGPNGSTIYLLYLTPVKFSWSDPSVTYTNDEDTLRRIRHVLNREATKRLRHLPYRILIEVAPRWSRASVVLSTATKVRAGLIVIATRGRSGLFRHGGLAEDVMQRARCPVLTVGPSALPLFRPPSNNLLHFPDSPLSERILPDGS